MINCTMSNEINTAIEFYSIDVATNQTLCIPIVGFIIFLISYLEYPIRKNEHKVQVLSFLKKK